MPKKIIDRSENDLMQICFPDAIDLLNARRGVLGVEVDDEFDGLGLQGVQPEVLVDAHNLQPESQNICKV